MAAKKTTGKTAGKAAPKKAAPKKAAPKKAAPKKTAAKKTTAKNLKPTSSRGYVPKAGFVSLNTIDIWG